VRKLLSRSLTAYPLRALGLFALAYIALAWLATVITPGEQVAVSIWPPAGLMLAALLLAPYRLWPAFLGAAVLANAAFNALVLGMPVPTSAGLIATNVVAACTAALLIGQWSTERGRLHDLHGALLFSAIAVVLVPALAAVLGATLLHEDPGAPWELAWLQWFFAAALGTLVVAPPLLADRGDAPETPGRRVEAIALAALLALTAWLVFEAAHRLPPIYLLPLLIWAGVRFGLWGGALAFSLTVLAGLSLSGAQGASFGARGAFALAQEPPPQLTLFGLTVLFVAALFREQQQAARGLLAANHQLEQRVAERTAALVAQEAATRDRLGEIESLYGSAPVGLAMLDPELRFVRVNDEMARLNGRPAPAHIGRSIEELLPDMAAQLVEPLRAVLASRQARFDVEVTGRAADGSARQLVQHWLPLADASGALLGVSVVCEEISELRRIERALRASELRFRRFAEHLDAVLWMIDPASGQVVYVSPAYERLWGRPPSALLADPQEWLRGVHAEDRAGVIAARALLLQEGRYDIEYRVQSADGALHWIRDRGFRMLGEGEPEVLAGIAEDVSDDVAAEADLADSEQRFRLAARAAQGMVYEYNVETGHVYRSDGLRRLLGYAPEEVPPTLQWWSEVIHPVDFAAASLVYADVFEHGGDTVETEVRARHRDGHWVHLWDRAYLDRNAVGKVRRVIGNTTDISERKRNAQLLAANEERLRVAAEAVQGVVYEWDVVTDEVVRSDGLKALLGWSNDEVPPVATWWRGQMDARDEARVFADLERAAKAHAPMFETEFRIRHRDGHMVHILDRSRLYYGANGCLSRAVGTAVDVTARRRAQAARVTLDVAGQRLARARDAAGVATAIVQALVPEHAGWCVVRVEPRVDAPQAVGRAADAALEAALQPLLQRWQAGGTSSGLLARGLTGAASLVEPIEDTLARAESLPAGTALLHAVPLPARERCAGVLLLGLVGEPVASHDAGQRELVEELARRAALAIDNLDLAQTTERALQQLKVQDRRKTEFLSMLAHELRNPLTPIRNAAEVLSTLAQGKPQLIQISAVLRRQTHKMARLIDDLLDMARITHGKVKLERNHVAVRDVVAQAADAVRGLLAGRGQSLVLDLPDEPMWVLGDSLRLEQVLINLLGNAAKFGADGDRIELSARAGAIADLSGGTRGDASATVEITVRDHGVGITPDLLPHVFDLFTQGERTPDRQQGGLGIGLSLVRSLIELHGGSVEVASDGPGRGACFTVRLPRAQSPAPTPPSPRSDAGIRLRVLVAEDNVDAADTLTLLLKKSGYKVMLARSGPEAVAIAREFRPQAVLLDIGLPGLDGFEVAQKLRDMGETADAMILAVSGYGDADSRRRAHAAGIDAYFVKPLDFEAALKQLREREKSRAPSP
jgi:PAS domain S-box-containing protein